MTELETIEGQVVEEMTGVAVELRSEAPVTLFRTEDPTEIIVKATAVATTLSDVLRKQKLTTRIGKSEHVRVEGWTLLGTMLGVFPVCVWTRKLDDGWEARVEARTRDGAVVGAAEAECLRSETKWADRDDYMLRSMAQTRATSKALRQPLGFVVSLAGFDPTPAEEMPSDAEQRATGRAAASTTGNIRVENAPTQASTWAGVKKLIYAYGKETWEDWIVFGEQAKAYIYPGEDELSEGAKAEMLQVTCLAANYLSEQHSPSAFPPPSRDELRAAWKVSTEAELEGPPWRMSPDETDRPTKQELEAAVTT